MIFVLVILLLTLPGVARASTSPDLTLPGVPGVAAPEYDPPVTPILGSSLWVTDGVDVAPAVGLRFGFPCSDAFSYMCPTGHWSVELGSILQHNVSGDFQHDVRTVGANTWDAHLFLTYEAHVAAVTDLPHGKQKWLVPEAGVGVSVMHMVSHLDYNQPGLLEQVDFGRTPVSPLLILGMRCLALGPVVIAVDVTYGWYANTFNWREQHFDFGMKGVAIRPSLQIRL
jgi:hypothetical protein